MLSEKWFINEITNLEVAPVENRGTLKAIITVLYGIFGLRGFRVFQKEEDGNLITWVKAPCFNKNKQYSSVPVIPNKSLWFKWVNTIRDMYLECDLEEESDDE